MKRFYAAILFLSCLFVIGGALTAANAEACFTLNVDILNMDMLNNNDYVAQHLSAQAQGIRVQKVISGSSELAQAVRLTLTQMDTQTLCLTRITVIKATSLTAARFICPTEATVPSPIWSRSMWATPYTPCPLCSYSPGWPQTAPAPTA